MNISQFFESNPNLQYKGLHLGCGSKYLQGWCNLDYYPLVEGEEHRGSSIQPDVWFDLKNEELGNDSFDIIYSSHVIEHFTYNESLALLSKCFFALNPGGFFIVEMPDLENLCLLYTLFGSKGPRALGSSNHSFISSQFYGASWENGSSDFPLHKYVWSKKEYQHACKVIGFKVILLSNSTLSHCPGRDFVIICQKPFQFPLTENLKASEWIQRYGRPILAPFKSKLSTFILVVRLFFTMLYIR